MRSEDLTVIFDADLVTELKNGALGAVGQAAGANVLAERDEKSIYVYPVALGELFSEHGEGLVGAVRGDITPAVGDTMDVNVHADDFVAAGNTEGQVGAFGADTGEGDHQVTLAG
jgi:hypothetical protein